MQIVMNIHCASPVEKVFNFLSTDEGRRKFWAETAEQKGTEIHFLFPNGQEYHSLVKAMKRPSLLSIEYFNSTATFILSETTDGGTNVKLVNEGVPPEEYGEVNAGWVSVLLTLKAAADFGVDLRNHQQERTWSDGYVDN